MVSKKEMVSLGVNKKMGSLLSELRKFKLGVVRNFQPVLFNGIPNILKCAYMHACGNQAVLLSEHRNAIGLVFYVRKHC